MKMLLFYTDPGSGMMLLQILLAFFASGAFYFRKYFQKLFGKSKPANPLNNVESSYRGAGVDDNGE